MKEKYENVQITVYFDHKNAHTGPYDPTTKEKIDMKKIGMVQKIIIDEKNDDAINGWISILRFNKEALTDIFSKGICNKNAQRWPMQIIIDEDNKSTLIENVWVEKMGYAYTTKDYVLVQNIDFIAEEMI